MTFATKQAAVRKKYWSHEAWLRCGDCGRSTGYTSTYFPCPYCAGKARPAPKTKRTAPKPLDRSSVKVVKRYKSSSEPGVVHEVKADRHGNFVSCSCTGFYYRKVCKHMAMFARSKLKGK